MSRDDFFTITHGCRRSFVSSLLSCQHGRWIYRNSRQFRFQKFFFVVFMSASAALQSQSGSCHLRNTPFQTPLSSCGIGTFLIRPFPPFTFLPPSHSEHGIAETPLTSCLQDLRLAEQNRPLSASRAADARLDCIIPRQYGGSTIGR